jgi:DNA polymerase III sliding clamp (beta) subunit (PCNA family)
MKIQIQKLRSALDLVEGLAKPKTEKVETANKGKGRGGKKTKTTTQQTWPILRNVLLKDGYAIATDLDMAVMIAMPEAIGEYLLPVKQVSKLLKFVPGTDDVEIEMKGNLVFLTWSSGGASYPTERASSFPVLPEIQPVIKGFINADLVVPNLLSMLDYCYAGEGKPVLSGVTLFLREQLELGAGDGFRMAFKPLPTVLPPSGGISTVILPAKAVATLGHLWEKAPRPRPTNGDASLISLVANKGLMEVEISPILIKIQFGTVGLMAKTIQGTPPDFKQMIAASGEQSKLQIYAPDLERALRQLQVPTKDGLGAVRMSWVMGIMKLAIETEKDGRVETSIPVSPPDGSGRIAVKYAYLQEYLQGKSGLITMAITSSTAPVQFTHSQSAMVAIMPMQVIWPDQAQAAAQADAVAEAAAITEAQPAVAEAGIEESEDKGEGEEEPNNEESTELEVTPQA